MQHREVLDEHEHSLTPSWASSGPGLHPILSKYCQGKADCNRLRDLHGQLLLAVLGPNWYLSKTFQSCEGSKFGVNTVM